FGRSAGTTSAPCFAPRIESRKPRVRERKAARVREPKVESREPKAESRKPKAESPKPKACRRLSLLALRRPERKRHRPVDDRLAVNARHALQPSHPAAQPDHIDFDDKNVASVHGTAIADPPDAHEVGQPLPVCRL